MKNNSKFNRGFIVPLLIGIIVVLFVAGGIYVYENKKAEAPISPTTETQSSNSITQTNSQSESVSLVSTTTWNIGKYASYPADVVLVPNSESTYTFPSTYFSGSSISSAKVDIYGSCGNDEPPTNIVIEGLNFYKSANGLAYYLPGTCNTEFVLSIATGTPTDVNSAAYQNLKNIFYTMVDSAAKKSQIPAVTQSSNVSSAISVPGMSQYTDSNFGFSFWYPNNWTISQPTIINNQFSGGTISKRLQISDTQHNGFEIDEINFSSGSVTTPDAGCMATYFFNINSNQWMQTVSGCDEAPTTSAVDTSTDTMGGLPVLLTQSGISSVSYIVPLSGTSAQKALLVSPLNSPQPEDIMPIINTIVATNPSVAIPWSTALQTKTIQAEANAYAGQ